LAKRRWALVALLPALAASGCGSDEGVSANATVAAYVSAPLCAGAERQLAREGQVGSVKLRVVCLPGIRIGKGLDLATIGANARRATEDSSSIAYIGEPTLAATRFSETILEEAGVTQLSNQPGDIAMTKLLSTIRRLTASGNPGNLRKSVHDELG